jgi:hypothetical protein
MRDLTATAAFGNFKTGALSELFDRYLDAKRRAGATPVASLRCKTKTQYRLYYSDGTGFAVYMGARSPRCCRSRSDTMRPYATFTGELATGPKACSLRHRRLRLPARQRDELRRRPDQRFVMMPFNHLGNIGMNKRFHGVTIEIDGSPLRPASGSRAVRLRRRRAAGQRQPLRRHGRRERQWSSSRAAAATSS